MFKWIGAVILVIIAAILLFAATRPDTILVQRSITINAPPDKIFPLLDDFHKWPLWAAQDKEDQTMLRTYSGAASGKGAVSAWTSQGSAGRGEMTITGISWSSSGASQPSSRIHVTVEFVKPLRVHNTHNITLEPVLGGTQVTWTAAVQNVYMMKVMGIFTNLEKFMGAHVQNSLENLKNLAEQ
jgi:hypothetical protein